MVNSQKVLIVDDEKSVCDIMAMVLEDAGFAVEKATGGREALAMIRMHRPSLVILDLIMPGVSGWDVYEALRKDRRTREIPIVITSADHEVLLQSRRLGAAAQLSKPFQLDDLVRVVADCISLVPKRKKTRAQLLQDAA